MSYTEIQLKIFSELSKALHNLGAPVHILSTVNSVGDSLDDDQVLDILQEYNSGNSPEVLISTDSYKEAEGEQILKRNGIETGQKLRLPIHHGNPGKTGYYWLLDGNDRPQSIVWYNYSFGKIKHFHGQEVDISIDIHLMGPIEPPVIL